MYQHLDVEEALRFLFGSANAYIVADTYLVVYQVGTPWFTNKVFLSEQLVLKLGGNATFAVVTEFLTRHGREAGAVLAEAGTALARSDAALASLYQDGGFTPACIALTKEL